MTLSVARMQEAGDGSMVTDAYRFGERQTYGPLEAPEGVDVSAWALGPFIGLSHAETVRQQLYGGMPGEDFFLSSRGRLQWFGARTLHDVDVVAIRERYAHGVSQGQLAAEYGVSQPTISFVVNGVGAYADDEVS